MTEEVAPKIDRRRRRPALVSKAQSYFIGIGPVGSRGTASGDPYRPMALRTWIPEAWLRGWLQLCTFANTYGRGPLQLQRLALRVEEAR